MDTVCVFIVSTIPSLNVPSTCISLPCLSSIHFLSSLTFLGVDAFALDDLNGPKVRSAPSSVDYNPRTSSQIDAAFQRPGSHWGRSYPLVFQISATACKFLNDLIGEWETCFDF